MPAALRQALYEVVSVDNVPDGIGGMVSLPAARVYSLSPENIQEERDPFAILLIENDEALQLMPDGRQQPRHLVAWRVVPFGPNELALDNIIEAITQKVAGKSFNIGGVAIRNTVRQRVRYTQVDPLRGALGWRASVHFESEVDYH